MQFFWPKLIQPTVLGSDNKINYISCSISLNIFNHGRTQEFSIGGEGV